VLACLLPKRIEMAIKMKNPTKTNTEYDEYLEIVYAQWHNILRLYEKFADKRPVMLYDIQEQRIYAYPYEDFKADLKGENQASLSQQYETALRTNSIVVFVRDNEERKLLSYSVPHGEQEKTRRKRKPTSTRR